VNQKNTPKYDKIWYIYISKFVVQKFKQFPPRLNGVSTLPCETWLSLFASEQQLAL